LTDTTRKLATIVALDVAGYSARTEADEARTTAEVAALRKVIEEIAVNHAGRVFNTAGDGFMLEFSSSLAAVQAAFELAETCEPKVRVGVHVGDVVVQPNGDLLGHGVNVAARLMARSDPGTALVSADVRRMIRGPIAERLVSRGTFRLDKMSEAIEAFAPSSATAPVTATPPSPTLKTSQLAQPDIFMNRRAMVLGGVSVLVLGAAGIAAWQFAGSDPASGAVPALAVLPFSNISGKADDVAFAAGLHDDLLTRLARFNAFRVIARTSVLGYANTTKKISQIAGELSVNAVLEGSVQRSGDRVRIAVQLIDGNSDTQKWGETYDRALTADNLFEIQREITEAIASALNAVLTTGELTEAFEGGTHNLKAYELFTHGRLLLRSGDYSRQNLYNEAIAAFDQALSLDPNYAGAHALKGFALTDLFWWSDRLDKPLRDSANVALERAEALAPDALETQLARGAYFYRGFLDYSQALSHIERALKAGPNSADAWYIRAVVTRRDGRFEESVSAFERAIGLDPQNTGPMVDLASLLGQMGEFSQAEQLFNRARVIDPTSLQIRFYTGMNFLLKGDAAGAWAQVKDLRSFPDMRVFYAITTRNPANVSFALEDWPIERRHQPQFPDTYEVMRASALYDLGKVDEARTILGPVKARLDASANPYPAAWTANLLVTPADVPGILGDLAGVEAAERDFLTNAPRDEFQKAETLLSLSIAFSRCGDRDRAMRQLEELERLLGPSIYLRATIIPALDSLRDHPGYLALKSRYEAWAARRQNGGS
jgi:adenylate cyclase